MQRFLVVSVVLEYLHKMQYYPFMTAIANPAASPPVRGMPKFPVIVEICPVSVSVCARVDNIPCVID